MNNLTLLDSERPKLYAIPAFLSAIGLKYKAYNSNFELSRENFDKESFILKIIVFSACVLGGGGGVGGWGGGFQTIRKQYVFAYFVC